MSSLLNVTLIIKAYGNIIAKILVDSRDYASILAGVDENNPGN
ncbi:hypothetical protein [uncultured Methanolobus sp.]